MERKHHPSLVSVWKRSWAEVELISPSPKTIIKSSPNFLLSYNSLVVLETQSSKLRQSDLGLTQVGITIWLWLKLVNAITSVTRHSQLLVQIITHLQKWKLRFYDSRWLAHCIYSPTSQIHTETIIKPRLWTDSSHVPYGLEYFLRLWRNLQCLTRYLQEIQVTKFGLTVKICEQNISWSHIAHILSYLQYPYIYICVLDLKYFHNILH
jgi:hypothetical protein